MKEILKFIKITGKIAKRDKKDIDILVDNGKKLLDEYKSNGYIKKLPLELLKSDSYTFIPLIEYLLDKNKGVVSSPVSSQPNSNWMTKSDFCFINVRGVGIKRDNTGNFIDAVKLLPSLRVNAIHLAPFFESALGIIYAVDSLSVINSDCINEEYLKLGMSGEEQLKFFVDFAHLLSMTVGFDLEPHTSQFSRVVLENPHLFRWLQFDKDRKLLDKEDNLLKEESQNKICGEVTEIVKTILKESNLLSLSERGKDNEIKIAHQKIVAKLIESGYWTIPSHTWKGAGIPQFKEYNKNDNYPIFKYLSWDNEDHFAHSFGVLTPFKFYDNIPINKLPTKDKPPVLNKKTLNYFINIFPKLQKKYNFDFVRFDFVDHIFDSIVTSKISYSDKLTPYILKKCIAKARSGNKRYIGAMAERMGTDLKNYQKVGFDLILGSDILNRFDKNFIKEVIKTNNIIKKANLSKENKSSIIFAVDTHDTGHSGFNCIPMLLYGIKGVALRHFVSRFCQDYDVDRPKYEVIGNQDGTIGLYEANNKEVSIEWQSDSTMLTIYHNIEDTYKEYKKMLKSAKIISSTNYKQKVLTWILEGREWRIVCGMNISQSDAVKNIKLNVVNDYKKMRLIDPYTKTIKELHKPEIDILEPLDSFILVIH